MTADEDNRAGILRSPVFRGLPAAKIDELARKVCSEKVVPGTVIFRKGDVAQNFYIISSGKVRVFIRHDNGIERERAVLGVGDNFGEVALLTGESRTATVEALEDTGLVVFSNELFESLVREYPDISRAFMKSMRTWLLRDEEIIEEEAEAVMKVTRMSPVDFLLILGVSILLALFFNHSNPNGIPIFPSSPDRSSIPAISAAAAMQEYKQGKALILDAMPQNFYQKRHIKGAVNMPVSLFDIVYLMNFPEEDKDRSILVYGSSISRPYDLEIASKLLLRGHADVKIIERGLAAWETQGYPVEASTKK